MFPVIRLTLNKDVKYARLVLVLMLTTHALLHLAILLTVQRVMELIYVQYV